MIVFVLSLLFSGLMAALFHLFWGRGAGELVGLWGLGFIGFLTGHLLAVSNAVPLPMLGALHVIPGCLGCLGGLLVANVLNL